MLRITHHSGQYLRACACMVSQLIDMSRFYDLAGIQIAVHRLAIDSVKISAALFIDFPLHGKYGILYALDSLLKVVFIPKSPPDYSDRQHLKDCRVCFPASAGAACSQSAPENRIACCTGVSRVARFVFPPFQRKYPCRNAAACCGNIGSARFLL